MKHIKLFHITKNFKKLDFHSKFIKSKGNNYINKIHSTVLNFEIKDIHIHINFLNKQKSILENNLRKIIDSKTFDKLICYNKNYNNNNKNNNDLLVNNNNNNNNNNNDNIDYNRNKNRLDNKIKNF